MALIINVIIFVLSFLTSVLTDKLHKKDHVIIASLVGTLSIFLLCFDFILSGVILINIIVQCN